VSDLQPHIQMNSRSGHPATQRHRLNKKEPDDTSKILTGRR